MPTGHQQFIDRFSTQDVSLLVAVIYTIGCTVLVANAIMSFMPFISPNLSLPESILYVEGFLSVLSCALFLLGSLFTLLEIFNSQGPLSVGWNLDAFSDSKTKDENESLKEATDVSRAPADLESAITEEKEQEPELGLSKVLTSTARASWRLLPTFHEIRIQYVHQPRFIANIVLLCGSFLYVTASIASLVTILRDSKIASWIRYPQLVAAVGFAISSAIMMVQSQEKWWKPAPRVMGWHVNLLNLIGSAGFILCACLGLAGDLSWMEFQFTCSYLWGKRESLRWFVAYAYSRQVRGRFSSEASCSGTRFRVGTSCCAENNV
jgi:hypothetical protein